MTYIANLRRVHVGPRDWDNGGATDYWLSAASLSGQIAAASATNPYGLSGWGWTTTSLLASGTTTGDFNSSGDQDQNHIRLDASADQLLSMDIFGGYSNLQRASKVLGYVPTKLVMEAHAQFNVDSANETTTFIGFATGTDAAAAGGAGAIRSGGVASTYFLTSDLGSDAGAAIDTLFHTWKIQVDATNTEWFIDGVSQGTITTETDIWPQPFNMIAGTTNRIALGWLHIWYE